MRAWRSHQLGTPKAVLQLETIADPTPGPGEVAIAVEAAGLNFADSLMIEGRYQEKMPLPFIPGIELAGRVIAVGAGVSTAVGQRVIAECLDAGGALAERIVVPERSVYPIAEGMSAVDAAALFIIYQTGHLALHRRARLQAGETLLVHAGAGGVGSAAIQLGKAAGARVIATAGGPEKVAVCLTLGADVAVDYLAGDFGAVVKQETAGRGADVIFDSVGGDIFDRSRRCVAWEGRIVVIGFAGGRIAQLPTNHTLLKNYSVMGLYAGEYRKVLPQVLRDSHADLMRLYQSGAIRPLVSEAVPFSDAPDALERITDRRTVGKLVVQMG